MPFLNISDGRTYATIPAGPNPTPFKDNGKLFAKFVGTKVQLFWQTNEGDIYQITPPGASGNTSLASVIWRPGVPSVGDAYETWAEIEAQIAAEDGNIIVQCDNQFAALVVPATADTECLGRVQFQSYTFKAGPFNFVTVADGGRIRNPGGIDNLTFQGSPTVNEFILLNILATPIFMQRGAGMTLDVGATVSGVRVDADFAGILSVLGCSFANNTGNAALGIFEINPGHTVLYADGFAFGQGFIPNRPSNMWQGDATTILVQVSDCSVGSAAPQSAFAGTLQYLPSDQTKGLFYDDANVTPPIAESTAQGAIDFLKRLVLGAGNTASRPLVADVSVGAMYFDTDLGLPIWSDGATYVDAAGVVV